MGHAWKWEHVGGKDQRESLKKLGRGGGSEEVGTDKVVSFSSQETLWRQEREGRRTV